MISEFILYFVSEIHDTLTRGRFQVVFSRQIIVIAANLAVNAGRLRVCGELSQKSV